MSQQNSIQKVLDWYEHHRKKVNENLGLLIALAASLAAIWTGHEATRGRIEAANASTESLRIQQQSVDAQIKLLEAQTNAFRFATEPIISVKAGNVAVARHANQITMTASVAFVVEGKTPALEVRSEVSCRLEENFYGMSGPLESNYYSLTSFIEPNHPVTTHECQATTGRPNTTLVVYGQIKYVDFHRQNHHTPFCFYLPYQRFVQRKPFLSCPESDGTFD